MDASGGLAGLITLSQSLANAGGGLELGNGIVSPVRFGGDLDFFHFLFRLGAEEDTQENKLLLDELASKLQEEDSSQAIRSRLNSDKRDEKQISLDEQDLSEITGIQANLLQELLRHPVSQNTNTDHSKKHFEDSDAFQIQFKDIFTPLQVQTPTQHPLHLLQQLPQHIANQNPAQGFGKTQGFSQDFMELIQKAYQKQRPIRVSISEDTALILKFNRQGQVSAQFVTTDAATEALLKQQLTELRQRLDDKKLPIGHLGVSSDAQQRDQDQNASRHAQDDSLN